MDLQDVATRPVKPCDNDELVAGGNAIQCPSGPRLYLEPCIRRALGTLSGRFTARLERGADHADGLQTGSGRRVAPLLLGNHAGSLFVGFLNALCGLCVRSGRHGPGELLPLQDDIQSADETADDEVEKDRSAELLVRKG